VTGQAPKPILPVRPGGTMASRTAVMTQFRYTLHPRLFLRFVNEKLTAATQVVSVHRSGNKELSRGRREQSRPDGPKDDDIMHGCRPGNSGRCAGKRVRFRHARCRFRDMPAMMR
jgi:hypothetical protein